MNNPYANPLPVVVRKIDDSSDFAVELLTDVRGWALVPGWGPDDLNLNPAETEQLAYHFTVDRYTVYLTESVLIDMLADLALREDGVENWR